MSARGPPRTRFQACSGTPPSDHGGFHLNPVFASAPAHRHGAAPRPSAVSGSFYPAEPQALRAQLARLLQAVPAQPCDPASPQAPHRHASAQVAGRAPRGATRTRAPWRRRLMPCLSRGASACTASCCWAPCTVCPVRGLAVPTVTAFSTPLGDVPLDTEALARLHALPQVERNDRAHAMEHSLEVQLPFLQTVLGDFSLVPLAVGDATPQAVAQVLDLLWDGDDTVIVIQHRPVALSDRRPGPPARQPHPGPGAGAGHPTWTRARPAARTRSTAPCWPHVTTA